MADLILAGGDLYHGSGDPSLRADIAITGDVITAIGDLSEDLSPKLSVSGLAVAPGFIDIHTHSDFSLLMNPPMRSTIAQGVTTELVGNCGVSVGLIRDDPVFALEKGWAERAGHVIDWKRLSGFLQRVESGGLGANIATLAGHGTIRKSVLGLENRPPSPKELVQMQIILAQAMEDGAVGFSTGLEYLPGGYAQIDEQAALASIAHEFEGFYATHLRNEGDTLIESVQEALTVAERSGAPLQLSHHKSEGRANWGKVATTLKMMKEARAAGMDVLTDQYPYTAYMTGLGVILLPKWASGGTGAELAARLKEPSTRQRVLAEMEAQNWDWNIIQIGIARNRREAQGLTLTQLGASEGKTPAEAALDLLIAEEGWVAAVHFAMSEDDVEEVLRDPHTMIGSDGVSNDPQSSSAEDRSHPRAFGTFPRVLSRYVRDREILSLSEGIRRMTSLPAQRLGLSDRGRLAVGMKADITVFDPKHIADRATFDSPHQYPTGITHVLVNGRFALRDGVQTDTLSGRVLRRA